MIPYIIQKCKEPKVAKTIVKEKKIEITLSDFKTYYEANIISTVWFGPKKRYRNQ